MKVLLKAFLAIAIFSFATFEAFAVDLTIGSLVHDDPVSEVLPTDLSIDFTFTGTDDLETMSIKWWVDDVAQPTLDWTATTDYNPGETIQLLLGSYQFYAKSIDPTFKVVVDLGDANSYPDPTPSDNSKTFYINSPRYDGGGQDYPDGYVTIGKLDYNKPVSNTSATDLSIEFEYDYNYDTLKTLDIDWMIGTTAQPTIHWDWDGNYVGSYTTITVSLGSNVFANATDISVNLTNPNGISDGNPSDNSNTWTIHPALATGSYDIGTGTGDDYGTLGEVADILSSGGVVGTGDIIFNLRPGVYSGGEIEFADLFQGENDERELIIQKMEGTTGDVVFEMEFAPDYLAGTIGGFPEPVTSVITAFYSVNNVKLKNLNYSATISDTGSGEDFIGDILHFDGTSGLEIDNCSFDFILTNGDPFTVKTNINAVNILNSHKIKFTNNTLESEIFPDFAEGCVLLNFNNSTADFANPVLVDKNTFTGGSTGINEWLDNVCDRAITITNNTFEEMTIFGVNLDFKPAFDCIGARSAVNVSNNTVRNFTELPIPAINQFGFCIYNGSTVSGNSFSGFKGNGGDTQAAVLLDHRDAGLLDDEVTVTGNSITGSEDIVGIKLMNIGSGTITRNDIVISNSSSGFSNAGIMMSDAGNTGDYVWLRNNSLTMTNATGIDVADSRTKMYYNELDVVNNDNPADGIAGFRAEGSVGYIANNRISGTFINGMELSNSGALGADVDGLFLCYNSIGVNSANNMSVRMSGGANAGAQFHRNMVMNFGTGQAMYADGVGGNPFVSNQNNLRTEGGVLAYYDGANQAALADWQAASGQDAGSASVGVAMDEGNMIPVEYNANLFYGNPLFPSSNPIFAECEQFDFQGHERLDLFFVGFAAPVVVATILNQPEDIIACYGTAQYLGVVANLDNGDNPKYRWFKDGQEIMNYNFNGIAFAALNYEMEGIYYCLVGGTNVTNAVKSDEIVVKALQEPTIMTQPEPQVADNGETVAFEVEANIYGNLANNYRTQIQWYSGTTTLMNGDKISGVNSSRLTISNIDGTDYRNYHVVLTGRCGNLTSKPAFLAPKPTIDISAQPMSVEMCKDTDFSFSVTAVGTNGGTVTGYQWYIGGVIADPAIYTGSTSSTMTGKADMNLTDVACKIMLNLFDVSFMSDMAMLTVHTGAEFTTNLDATKDLKVGDDFSVTVEATGFGTMTYKWYSSVDASLDNTSSTLSITDVKESHTAQYYCDVTDDCGTVSSVKQTLTVTKNSISTSVSEQGLGEMQISPNPFDGKTIITFGLTKRANVKLVISDMSGNEVLSVDKGMLAPSTHSVTFDANKNKLNTGTYFVTVFVNGLTQTRKMMFVK